MNAAPGSPILELKSVSRVFDGIRAVDNVSLKFYAGEIVGLIGPNGAGKTTLVNLISGFIPLSSGDVIFEGKSLARSKPHTIAQAGIARTFQIVQPFAKMTVLENVMAGAIYAGHCGMRQARDKAIESLEFAKLAHLKDMPASELALANRKRLELAKSLAMNPRILMLDEVNAGLNSSEIDEAVRMVKAIAARGITIIVIEHLMRVVTSLAQRAIVLHHGAVVSEGPTDQVFRDPRVIEAYLGNRFAERFAKAATLLPLEI
ncbi:MAG: branched-chain amino acid transporter ATP-binding protein [Bradyrhizobium sp.]|jgi:branched-chain amino acid transport system ATP-binding protein|nr:branched-chain amino acid transporter ATP-binding protein [Bradyrhizobium sp.]MEA2869913.1 branched-chain amino acid transport system ATP-binding protein [Bradyrhizobium sp.]